MGLNPGTAIYAYIMARHDQEITIITNHQGDHVELLDLKPHAVLGVLSDQVIKLFSIKYLVDIMGIRLIKADLGDVEVSDNGDVVINDRRYHFDRVIVGSEVELRDLKGAINNAVSVGKGVRIVSGDPGLALNMALLLSELKYSVNVDLDRAPLDHEMVRALPIRHVADYEGTLNLEYKIRVPIVHGTVERLGRGFKSVDSLSGVEYLVTRDYELLVRGKLMALRDLGLIGDLKVPRLEVGLGLEWSYVAMGLSGRELGGVYRDLSSSRVSYRWGGRDLMAKVLYRGGRILGMQFVVHGVGSLNWAFMVYALLLTGNTPLLLLDMGYEGFGTTRGLLEHLVMDVLNI